MIYKKDKSFKLKKSFLVVALICILLLISCNRETSKTVEAKSSVNVLQANNSSIKKDRLIIVYYFHTTYRCYSCTRIEALTKESLSNSFKNLLDSGKIVFKRVNIEKTENKHFVQDYKLFTKSVVVVDRVKGKRVNWKRLDKTWNYLRDPDVFHKYITDEVNSMIKG